MRELWEAWSKFALYYSEGIFSFWDHIVFLWTEKTLDCHQTLMGILVGVYAIPSSFSGFLRKDEIEERKQGHCARYTHSFTNFIVPLFGQSIFGKLAYNYRSLINSGRRRFHSLLWDFLLHYILRPFTVTGLMVLSMGYVKFLEWWVLIFTVPILLYCLFLIFSMLAYFPISLLFLASLAVDETQSSIRKDIDFIQ